jgi:hypothetical protein
MLMLTVTELIKLPNGIIKGDSDSGDLLLPWLLGFPFCRRNAFVDFVS